MEFIKRPVRKLLSERQYQALRYKVLGKIHTNNLDKLAQLFATDKFGYHFYTQHYQRHFERLKRKPINLLEIGIGGWNNPQAGGNSLRMWKAYFPKADIYGIDIQDKSYHNEKRIKTFKGSQENEEFLKSVIDEIGQPDIIIDDGSHYTHHVIKTFKILFPSLKQNGIYVVEDLQTSYWHSTEDEDWSGSEDVNAPHTSMNFFKSLVDGLNFEEYRHIYEPTYFDRQIIGMHFYHNLLFIEKGLNNEGSNMVKKHIP
jgi:hypothetical protein